MDNGKEKSGKSLAIATGTGLGWKHDRDVNYREENQMATAKYAIRYRGETWATFCANWAQASCPIWVGWQDDACTGTSMYQVGDARHRPDEAAALLVAPQDRNAKYKVVRIKDDDDYPDCYACDGSQDDDDDDDEVIHDLDDDDDG